MGRGNLSFNAKHYHQQSRHVTENKIIEQRHLSSIKPTPSATQTDMIYSSRNFIPFWKTTLRDTISRDCLCYNFVLSRNTIIRYSHVSRNVIRDVCLNFTKVLPVFDEKLKWNIPPLNVRWIYINICFWYSLILSSNM